MTKTDLLKLVNLNQREIEAFGGKITIRDLTVKELIQVSELDGIDAMLKMISCAMVKPSMSIEELESFSGVYSDDLTKIVEAVTPNGKK